MLYYQPNADIKKTIFIKLHRSTESKSVTQLKSIPASNLFLVIWQLQTVDAQACNTRV